jgi:hypothetical protein
MPRNIWAFAQGRPHAGESKIFMSTRDTLIRAYMAGAILGLAAAFAVMINVQTGYPIIGAILFPVGLCMLYLQTCLGRALGINPQIEIDYRMIPLEAGDVFLLMTDGAYEHVEDRFVIRTLDGNPGDLDAAARAIVAEAYRRGSEDNLTVQIVRIDAVPDAEASEVLGPALELPLPPLLEPGMTFDGYRIVREVHGSSRSHIYLGVDLDADTPVAIKIPSIDLRGDPAYLKRFMMEEWIARRIDSPDVLKPRLQSRRHNYLYVVTEFIDGLTLSQWMIDHPRPDLETVRGIVEQIAKGLRAFHRMEMLHRDLRPDRPDQDGEDHRFRRGQGRRLRRGRARRSRRDPGHGAIHHARISARRPGVGPLRDMFALGVITYQMLTGQLPYGASAAKARTRSEVRKLGYGSVLDDDREIPVWIDRALQKAVHPDPNKRYESLSEFLFDLRHPNANYLQSSVTPLLERNRLLFWKCTTVILACIVIALLASQHGLRH